MGQRADRLTALQELNDPELKAALMNSDAMTSVGAEVGERAKQQNGLALLLSFRVRSAQGHGVIIINANSTIQMTNQVIILE